MSKLFFFPVFLFLVSLNTQAQTIATLHTKGNISLRGLSAPDANVVWVSGSQGTVGKSTDGGKNWTWITVPGFEKTDFRDIEAFDKHTAIIMGVGSPAHILRTTDGGDTWTQVYQNNHKNIFLDAMEFWNDMSGIVIGDPIDGRFFIARTFDGGKTWQELPIHLRPVADSGEACFAASGTNVRKISQSEAVFISGGMASHIFIRDKKIKLPLIQGTQSSGANSVAVNKKKTLIVVGGDFTKKEDTTANCAISFDGGYTWKLPVKAPAGYRSCVEFLSNKEWITCGLNGVDISTDDGIAWKNISTDSYHVVRKSKKGNAVFLAGNGGRIGKLEP